MLARILALGALLLTTGCALSTKPLPLQTAMPPMQQPDACRTDCPRLPTLDSGDEAAVVIWIHETISAAGECRRMHDACRGFDGRAKPE